MKESTKNELKFELAKILLAESSGYDFTKDEIVQITLLKGGTLELFLEKLKTIINT